MAQSYRGGPPGNPGYGSQYPQQPPPNQGGYASNYGGPPPNQGGYASNYGGPPPNQGGYPPQQNYGAQSQAYPPQGYQQQGGGPPPYGGGGPPNAAYQSAGPNTPGSQSYYLSQIPPAELQQMRQWFQAVDRDRSGKISAQELSSMNFGGLRFTYETARLLIKVFDKNRNAEIDFEEYAALHKFISSMYQAFQMYDKDRSGSIDPNEAEQAVRQGGFQVSPGTMRAIYNKYYVQGSPGLTLEQFMSMCAHLGMCRSAFYQLDKNRSGSVNLNLDQFLLVTSTL